MSDTNTENMTPVENKTSGSKVVRIVVGFHDLKDFITVERGGSLSGVGRLTGFSPATFFKALNNQGTNPSSIVIMHWLERHYGITIEGDPYR